MTKSQKLICCFIGIAIIFLLGSNSNNIPESFIQRIFKPIRLENGRIYYGGLILICALFFCLTMINKIEENSLLKTRFRRIIALILILNIFETFESYPAKIYKSFSRDLNSIYIYRGNSDVEFRKNDEKLNLYGKISVFNCSNEPQKFKVKVKTTKLVKDDIQDDYVTLKKVYTVGARNEAVLDVAEEISTNIQGGYEEYGSSAFEYILYNDESLVIFKGKDYQYDEE